MGRSRGWEESPTDLDGLSGTKQDALRSGNPGISNSMTNSKPHSNNHTGERSAESKERIENRLTEAGVRTARSVSVEEGTKETKKPDHPNPSNHTLPGLIDGNYTIHGGDGLAIIDIDAPELSELPAWLRYLPGTLLIESPHDGLHLLYALEDDSEISNSKAWWGSIRYDGWYTLGPGSILDHDRNCDDCGKTGQTAYTIHTDKPIASLTEEHLDALRKTCGTIEETSRSKGEEYGGEMITLPDETAVEEANRYICTDFPRHSTDLARSDMMDQLRGGTGTYHLRRDDGSGRINQSAADYFALDAVYGAFRFRGEDEDEARRLTLDLFKHYCRENPYDKTGTLRKWLRKGEGYLTEQMDAVEEYFDEGVGSGSILKSPKIVEDLRRLA